MARTKTVIKIVTKAVAKIGSKAVTKIGTRAVAKIGSKAVTKIGTRAVAKIESKAVAIIGIEAMEKIRTEVVNKIQTKVRTIRALYIWKKPAGGIRKSLLISCLTLLLPLFLTGCVDQSQGAAGTAATGETPDKAGTTETGIAASETDRTEDLVILATSMATVSICEKLNLPLDGIPDSDLSEPPERYKDLPKIGLAMSPDMEVVSSMKPDWILSPVSLISDLQPKYEAINTDYAFLNLNSVAGMYKSIEELGVLFDREEAAEKLVNEFEEFYNTYKDSHKDFTTPKVLILMGLPGSYVVATENSYVGSLVKMAGGINVYEGETADFITANTEDMLKKDPDIILRTAHALPDEVMEMFAEEFKTNDIWKNFRAVKEEKVFDLSYEKFGMSATFDYPEALTELDGIFYEEAEAK